MDRAHLDTYGWPILGIYLIVINIISLIAGVIIRYPYEALWISYYVGVFQGINCFWRFSKPLLNGIYCYLFIFQLGSFVLHLMNPVFNDLLDVLYWFYHAPHLMGFYLLAKRDFDLQGVNYGFLFLLSMLLLTWYLLFLSDDPTKYMINTTFRIEHAFVVGLAFGWYFIVHIIHFVKSKQPHPSRWLLMITS